MNENLAGLINFLKNEDLDVVFLQEIRMSSDHLQSKVVNFGYKAESNFNEDEPSKPGTAFLWKSSVPINNIVTLVQCRCQVAFIGRHILLNVYAQSGSEKRRERGNFFVLSIFFTKTHHSHGTFFTLFVKI